MKTCNRVLSWIPFFCLAAPSLAAATPNLEGAVRVGLDASLFEYARTTRDAASVTVLLADGRVSSVTLPDTSSTRTTLGMTGGGMGVRVGGAPSDGILVGGRFAMGSTTIDNNGSDTVTTITLIPSVEFFLGSSETARPFVSVDAGYGWQISSHDGGADTKSAGALLGGGAGIHAFVTDSFSIDPAVNVFYTTGSVDAVSTTYDQTGVTVWVNIGVSGWIRRKAYVPGAGALQDGPKPPQEEAPLYARPPQPAPPRVAEDRGRLTTSFPLETVSNDPPGQRLRLVVAGEPRGDGENASLLVMGLVATKEDAACAKADLVVDGASTPLSDVQSSARAGFSASEYTLQMKIDVHALEKLGESHGDASIGVCGVRRAIAPEGRANVYEWVEQFRAKARAAGTWKEAK